MRTVLFTVAAAGAAAAAAAQLSSRSELSAFEAASRRGLQSPSIALCNSKVDNAQHLIATKCDMITGGKLSGVWDSCCSFGNTNADGECRHYTMEGQYCATCDLDSDGTCTTLEAGDQLVLAINFTEIAGNQQCCKSCTCFGDPECISFNGVLDLWIPCDARKNGARGCNPTRATCEAITGPGDRQCEWLRTDRNDASGWPMAFKGSPCQPVNIMSDPIMMNMYDQTNNKFKVDLQLGERGVILAGTFTIKDDKYTLNSDDCFATSGAASWVGGRAPPGAQSFTAASGTEVSWVFYSDFAKAFVKLNCVRAVDGAQAGLPRLNIQEVTVSDQSNGNGFCASDSISDKSGSNVEASNGIHEGCTLSEPTALQACKNLVSQALTSNDLQACAMSYCAMGQLPLGKCLQLIGNGNSDNAWSNTYCQQVQATSGVAINRCKNDVKQGYTYAIENLGYGFKSGQIGERECGTSLAQYAYDLKPPCEDGVSLEVEINGEWVPKYFFPASSPPCNGALTISGTDNGANVLFSHPIRLTQCSVKSDAVCQNVSPCSNTYGVTFSLQFTNLQRQLTDLYNNGALLCAPRADDTNVPPSYTWCLPNAPDYKPTPEMCPCPNGNGQGRLLLMGQKM